MFLKKPKTEKLEDEVETASSFFDLVKKNVLAIGTAVGLVTTIIGGYVAIDSHYASAEDVNSVKQYVIQSHEYNKYEQKRAINQLRKQQLEDKIFELQLDAHPSVTTKALIGRYQTQLDSVNNELNQPPPSEPAMGIAQPK